MNPPTRRVASFGVQFLGFLLLSILVYPWVAPLYQRAVAGLAAPFLGSRTRIELTDGGLRYLDRTPLGAERETVRFDRQGLRLNTLNLVLLPSLLLATPVSWRRRLRLLGIGLALLFAVQWLSALLWAPTSRCLSRDPNDLLCSWLFYSMITGGQAYSIVIWGLLAWRHWLPAERPRPAVTAAGRNVPCPCGSGKKFKHCCAR